MLVGRYVSFSRNSFGRYFFVLFRNKNSIAVLLVRCRWLGYGKSEVPGGKPKAKGIAMIVVLVDFITFILS
jgi:hypothetical protein